MNLNRKPTGLALFVGLVLGFVGGAGSGFAAGDLQFATLQSGTEVYSNVTVFRQTKTDLFISHARGLGNLKISTLDDETLRALGLKGEAQKSVGESLNPAAAMVKVNAAVDSLSTKFPKQSEMLSQLQPLNLSLEMKLGLGVGAVLLYLCTCACLKLICLKAGSKPGFLVWLPLLQIIPLFRAAKLSGWYALLLLIPLVNIGIYLWWCFRLAKACGRGPLLAVFLFLPLTNLFAFLFLALGKSSDASSEADSAKPVQLDGWASA